MKEPYQIWALLTSPICLLYHVRLASSRNILHCHQYLVNPCDVLLHLRDVMLQHSHLDSLGTPNSFHNCSVLIADVLFDNILQSINFVDSMIQSNDLRDQLGPLGHDAGMDRTVNKVESVAEGFVHS